MSIIAAFLWKKSPTCSISTMIFDDETLEFFLSPQLQFLPIPYLQFRRATKKIVCEFFLQLQKLTKISNKPIIIEFKIVFHAHEIPYLKPSRESKFVYKTFKKRLNKAKKELNNIKIQPQLRKLLSGKHLSRFKREIRSLYLVRRKRDTGFEYHLWVVALHATPTTYVLKLQQIRTKLINAMWDMKNYKDEN